MVMTTPKRMLILSPLVLLAGALGACDDPSSLELDERDGMLLAEDDEAEPSDEESILLPYSAELVAQAMADEEEAIPLERLLDPPAPRPATAGDSLAVDREPVAQWDGFCTAAPIFIVNYGTIMGSCDPCDEVCELW